jgi:hypothetical protein
MCNASNWIVHGIKLMLDVLVFTFALCIPLQFTHLTKSVADLALNLSSVTPAIRRSLSNLRHGSRHMVLDRTAQLQNAMILLQREVSHVPDGGSSLIKTRTPSLVTAFPPSLRSLPSGLSLSVTSSSAHVRDIIERMKLISHATSGTNPTASGRRVSLVTFSKDLEADNGWGAHRRASQCTFEPVVPDSDLRELLPVDPAESGGSFVGQGLETSNMAYAFGIQHNGAALVGP